MFWIGLTQRSISSTAVGMLRRVARQRPQLVGMAQQLVHAAAEHVAGRLVAADEDEQALHQQLVVAQPLAVDLGVHEDADQVVARMRAAIGDDARADRRRTRRRRAAAR